MPPFNFRVALDLTAFFEDYRSKCYIYVDVAKIRVVEDLEKHIRDRFGIKDNIFVCTNDYYVPSSESIDILHTNEILKVCQKEVRTEGNDNGIFNSNPEGGKKERKKRKTKRIQTNPGDILNHGLLSSLTSNNSMQFDCGDGQNIDGDTKVKTIPAVQNQEYLQESKPERKRKTSQKHSLENEGRVLNVEKKDVNIFGFKEEVVSSCDKDCEEQPKKKQKRNSRQEEYVPMPSSSTVQLIVQQCKKTLKMSDEALLPHTEEEGNTTAPAQEEVRECNGNLLEGGLPAECSVSEDYVFKRRRKRVRHRKKKTHHETRQPNPPWNSGSEKVSLTPKELNSSVNHIRFHSEDEMEKGTTEEVPQSSASVPNEKQQLGDVKPKLASISKWDEKPRERKHSRPLEENNSGLTLDEVWNKTLPSLRYQPTTIIFDCPKTELPDNTKTENVDNAVHPDGDSESKKDEILMEDGSVGSVDIHSNMTSSPLEGLPRKNDLIAFKMFRLSEEYTPVLSNHITARVVEYDSKTFNVKLQILKGHEELIEPKGRFSLDDQTEEPKCDIMELNWNEMLDPLLIFP